MSDGRVTANSATNPPPCERCGKPVHGHATNGGGAHYHADCYAAHDAEQWAAYEKRSGIGATSHDERVQDGTEYP